jgi:membrane-bound metal-dependent hydrolase YbcI (DUF457 family)
MFIGHFAVGFASKRLAPSVSLGVLLAAPLLLDLLWPVFLAVGLESVRIDPGNTAFTPLDLHDYPYTHSLVGALAWSALGAALLFAYRRDARASAVIAAGVFSHWVLDWVTHRPDMPLYPGSETRVGLGLWNSIPGTILVETALFVAGIVLYLRGTRARDRIGSIAWWSLIALLVVFYVLTLLTPPPADVKSIIVGGLVAWLFLPWAWWIDRHRERVPAAA